MKRPSFHTIRNFLFSSSPQVMKVSQDFTNVSEDFVIKKGDTVAIIEGNPEEYLWRGQNLKTYAIGNFPR